MGAAWARKVSLDPPSLSDFAHDGNRKTGARLGGWEHLIFKRHRDAPQCFSGVAQTFLCALRLSPHDAAFILVRLCRGEKPVNKFLALHDLICL
jgi:hypothetical protein